MSEELFLKRRSRAPINLSPLFERKTREEGEKKRRKYEASATGRNDRGNHATERKGRKGCAEARGKVEWRKGRGSDENPAAGRP